MTSRSPHFFRLAPSRALFCPAPAGSLRSRHPAAFVHPRLSDHAPTWPEHPSSAQHPERPAHHPPRPAKPISQAAVTASKTAPWQPTVALPCSTGFAYTGSQERARAAPRPAGSTTAADAGPLFSFRESEGQSGRSILHRTRHLCPDRACPGRPESGPHCLFDPAFAGSPADPSWHPACPGSSGNPARNQALFLQTFFSVDQRRT